MQPPSFLWPWSWWTVGAAVVLLVGASWLAARARVYRRNRELGRLGLQLRQLGMTEGSNPFSIGEGKNVLVVSSDKFAVADLKYWRIIQTLTFDEASFLTIYDHQSNLIEFRLAMNGGARTRKIATQSIAGFGRLFGLLGRGGKPVQYIES
jgi:hypothetical protein